MGEVYKWICLYSVRLIIRDEYVNTGYSWLSTDTKIFASRNIFIFGIGKIHPSCPYDWWNEFYILLVLRPLPEPSQKWAYLPIAGNDRS